MRDKIVNARRICRKWGEAHFKRQYSSRGDSASAMSHQLPRVARATLNVGKLDPVELARESQTWQSYTFYPRGRSKFIVMLANKDLVLMLDGKDVFNSKGRLWFHNGYLNCEFTVAVTAQGKQRPASQESREPDWPPEVELLDKVLNYMNSHGYKKECAVIKARHLSPNRAGEDVARRYGIKVFGRPVSLTKLKEDLRQAYLAISIIYEIAVDGGLPSI